MLSSLKVIQQFSAGTMKCFELSFSPWHMSIPLSAITTEVCGSVASLIFSGAGIAMVITPPTSSVGSVEHPPSVGSFILTWVGWEQTMKGKVNSWFNLQTSACTDIVQPGVLYRSWCRAQAIIPLLVGLHMVSVTLCFNEPFVFRLRLNFTVGFWAEHALCCAVKSASL